VSQFAVSAFDVSELSLLSAFDVSELSLLLSAFEVAEEYAIPEIASIPIVSIAIIATANKLFFIT